MNTNDSLLRLMTAALDGELSTQERRRLRRLLRMDSAAMALFRKLRDDKRRLAAFPVPVLPIDFSRSVDAFLSETKLKEIASSPSCPTRVRGRGGLRIQWMGALALGLAWVVGLAFLSTWISVQGSRRETPAHAATQGKGNQGALDGNTGRERDKNLGPMPVENDLASAPPGESWKDWLSLEPSPADQRADGNDSGNLADSNPKASEGQGGDDASQGRAILGAPARARRELEELTLRLPHIVSWNDLGVFSSAYGQLKDHAGTIHLDIPSQEPGLTVESLLRVMKSQKRGVVVDALAGDRLRRGNVRAHYMVVLEEVNGGQLETILKALQNDTGKAPVSKSGQLSPAMIISSPETVRRQLKSMTGWDLGTETPAKGPKPAISKDLGEETTQQALKAIETGGNGRLAGIGSSSLPTVLVMAYSPYFPAVKTQPQSVEVRRFLEIRQASAKTGHGRAILVFRNGN